MSTVNFNILRRLDHHTVYATGRYGSPIFFYLDSTWRRTDSFIVRPLFPVASNTLSVTQGVRWDPEGRRKQWW